MEPTDEGETVYYLEQPQVFSRSLIWDLQRHYFAEKGVEAWRRGEVPHYVTSNPAVANVYAEMVFACLRDQSRLAPGGEPLYLCELGAGSGRFAFHFLKRLTRLCEQSGLSPAAFRYVLTDMAESNLDFWRRHPRFRPFFEGGLLDLALFDINQSARLDLRLSGETVGAGSLARPLVVIANYVFDSIPQELFYIHERQCHQCMLTLGLDEEVPLTLTAAEMLELVRCRYDYLALSEPPYPEPELRRLLSDYQHALDDTHLLFPAAGLRCLQRLKALSRQGLLVLSADKGDISIDALQDKSPPRLICHGSFSLNVNYHAFKSFCEQSGGVALFPGRNGDHLHVNCLLLCQDAPAYVETERAYRQYVQDFGPDDFYTIIKHARGHLAEATVSEILAYLRLSHYDSHHFGRYCLPRLRELAMGLGRDERRAVAEAVDRVWDSYFSLGEELDLAHESAGLLYEMDDYAGALVYFERSIEIYGEHAGTLFNMAACCQMTGQPARAESLLRKVLQHDPDNRQAADLLAAAES